MSPVGFESIVLEAESLLHRALDDFSRAWCAEVALTPAGQPPLVTGRFDDNSACDAASGVVTVREDSTPIAFECARRHLHVRMPTTLGLLDVTSMAAPGASVEALSAATVRLADTVDRIGKHPDALVVAEVATALAELSVALSFDDVLCRVLDIVGNRICFDYANIARVDTKRNELEVIAHKIRPNPATVGNSSFSPFKWSMDTGVTGRVATTRTPLCIKDVEEVSYFLRHWPNTRSELACPLMLGNDVLAVLNLESQHVGHFDEHHLSLVLKIAPILAVAVERAQQRDSISRKDAQRRQQAATLAELHQTALALTKSNEAFRLQHLAEAIVRLFPDFYMCALRLNDPEKDQLLLVGVGQRDLAPNVVEAMGQAIPRANSVSGRAIRENRAVKAYDLPNNPDFFNPALARALDLKGMLVVPITSHDSPEPLGCFAAYTNAANYRFQAEDESLLQEIASYVAVSLSNIRMSLMLAAREETSEYCRHSPRTRSTLDAIARLSCHKIGAQGASVFLLENSRLRLKGTTGVLRAHDWRPVRDYAEVQYAIGEGKTGWVAKHERALRIVDEGELTKYALGPPKFIEDLGESGVKFNFLAVPIRSSDRTVGVIRAARKQQGLRFTPRDQAILAAIADQLGAALTLDDDTDTSVAVIAHQLTYPLESVRTNCEELLQFADGAVVAEGLRTISSHCRLAISLVHNITTAKHLLDDPYFPLQWHAVDVAALVADNVAVHVPLARKKGLRIVVGEEGLRDLSPVDGDELLLSQALLNVLNNAVSYSHGSKPIQVYRYGSDDRLCTVCVQNQGFPIRERERELIFERGYRADVAKGLVPTGSGLGLAVTRAIVRRHFGDITVDSIPVAKGLADTRFYLTLRFRRPEGVE
jgi:signal transduction histidine kinase